MQSDKNKVAAAGGRLYVRRAVQTSVLLAAEVSSAAKSRTQDRLQGTLVSTATKLLPLVELIERIRPHMVNDSVFTSRRAKMNAQLVIIQEQLRADEPKHKAIAQAFKTMGEFVLEESREVSKDEVKESAKRFVLVALKTAPDLIRAAHTAGLLS
ncbi:hypothetical protein [Hymenobacter elongatus]|uniref:Uncharacterized protein n=1 Tax=Hymenobacter elongatus TaxID=877208 RepID=A0A4Z0PHL6_9BACT|nr:hypothetical protein [Hymenobacter elongatus]TGE14712.1 hypothetical protein E5J99_15130 [Hymenobacter elongatus]